MSDVIKHVQKACGLLLIVSLAIWIAIDDQKQKDDLQAEARLLVRLSQELKKFKISKEKHDLEENSILLRELDPRGEETETWLKWTDVDRDGMQIFRANTNEEDVFHDSDIDFKVVPNPELSSNGHLETKTVDQVWATWAEISDREKSKQDLPVSVRLKKLCDAGMKPACKNRGSVDVTVCWILACLHVVKPACIDAFPSFWSMFPQLRSRFQDIHQQPISDLVPPILINRIDGPVDLGGGFRIFSGYQYLSCFLALVSAYLLLHIARLLPKYREIAASRDLFLPLWEGWLGVSLTVFAVAIAPSILQMIMISTVSAVKPFTPEGTLASYIVYVAGGLGIILGLANGFCLVVLHERIAEIAGATSAGDL